MNEPKITNEHIRFFIDDFVDRISRTYNENILDIVNETPAGIVNYNNILLLKKAQKYVRHTDLIFSKSICGLFASLFRDKGLFTRTPQDSWGKCVYVKETGEFYHFIPLEKFAGFPKVPWFSGVKEVNEKHYYVVLVEKDSKGMALVQKGNDACENNSRFSVIEDFVCSEFGRQTWIELASAFHQIEKTSRQFQWFDLAEVCSDYNKTTFIKECESILLNKQYHLDIPEAHFRIIKDNFDKDRYRLLLSDEDFAKSFFTSEWLFQKQMKNDNLDKTYIVAGYFKSIEQLLAYCIKTVSSDGYIDIFNGRNVSVSSTDFAKATLGNMQHYIGDLNNRKIFDSRLSNRSIVLLNRQLAQWIKEERNGFFHKDNISDIGFVDRIRDATYNMYLLILGSLAVQSGR